MKNITQQQGSSHIVLVLAAVVIVSVGFVGFKVVSTKNKSPKATSTATAAPASIPTTIKSKSDLKQANTSLDNEKIDQNLNPNQLDGELDSIY